MSGQLAVAQGFPLTLSPSKHVLSRAEGGERKAFFNGLLARPGESSSRLRSSTRIGCLDSI
jgi:hypothetical protein